MSGQGGGHQPATLTGGFQALLGPLHNPLPLELGDRRENVKHEPSSRAGRVDVSAQGPKPGALSLDLIDDIQEVLQAPRQTVVFRHDDHIPIPEFLQHPIEFRTGPCCPGDRVCESSFHMCFVRGSVPVNLL